MANFNKNYIVLADYAALGNDGKLQISGIFEVIYAQSLPAMHQKLFLVGNFESKNKDLNEAVVEVDILNESGKSIAELKLPNLNVDLSRSIGKKKTFNILYEINNIKFSEYGLHKFVIRINNEEAGSFEFYVDKPAN